MKEEREAEKEEGREGGRGCKLLVPLRLSTKSSLKIFSTSFVSSDLTTFK